MIETPFNYTGSKYKLLEQLLPEFDYSKPYFIDLFCGGGSVYTNVVDRYSKVVANDIISDLVGIHESLINSNDIISETISLCPGKANPLGFADLRNDYNNNPTSSKLWALMLSSTNNMMRFNQKFKYNQTYGDRGWNPNTDRKVNSFIKHIREYRDSIKFISKPFNEVEIKSDKVMVYCDPPYSNTEAGYNAYWKKDDDLKLYEYLKNIDRLGSSFVVSGVLKHDDKSCYLLERLIEDGYKYKELDFNYNRVSRSGKKETKEIIIKNF